MTPEPLRPLGQFGTQVWERIWSGAVYEAAAEPIVQLVQLVCEQIDERAQLRFAVIRDQGWRDRAALRALDVQIATGLTVLVDRMGRGASDFTSSLSGLLAEMDDPA